MSYLIVIFRMIVYFPPSVSFSFSDEDVIEIRREPVQYSRAKDVDVLALQQLVQ